MKSYVYRSFKNICKIRKISHWCRTAIDQEKCNLDVIHSDVRLDVPTLLVYDGSLFLADVCGLLRNLLVHQEIGYCSEKVTGNR